MIMKNVYKIVIFSLLIGQWSIAQQTEKRPVGRPKMIGPKLPPKVPGKVGRPATKNKGFILINQNNDKNFTLVKQNNVPMVKSCTALTPVNNTTVKNIVPVKTGFQKLATGLRFFRGGIVGSLVGYAGAHAVDVLTDAEQRKAIAEKFSLNNVPKDFFTNELYKQEVGLERKEQSASNNAAHNEDDFVPRTFIEPVKYTTPLFLKYGAGALALAGLGYVVYKIYEKVYDNYFKNKKIINK
jgi:hypothetical protein